MQLPVTGHPLHTRSLTTVVTMGEGGMLRARGDVNDLRKCGFVPMVGGIQPAGIIHQMSIDLTLDPGTRRIESLDTDQPFVAVEPSEWTRGECCRDPVVRLQDLVGECIDGALPKKLSRVFGGPRGCSHLLTLFQLMAAALPRALQREEAIQRELGVARRVGERLFWRSAFIDGYEAQDGAIELAVQLHDFHSRPVHEATSPLERFLRHDEVRVFARVESSSMVIEELRAFERIREGDTLASAEWQDRDEFVAPLAGLLIIPGLAGRIFAAIPSVPETAILRDAMLQLAPGQIQVLAALTDRWFSRASRQVSDSTDDSTGGPPVGAIGGMADSCYMWRSDGPLAGLRGDQPDSGPPDPRLTGGRAGPAVG